MGSVGTLTFHHVGNYGAILQAYALQQTLVDMGHDVEVIDYQPNWANGSEGSLFRRMGRPVIRGARKILGVTGEERQRRTEQFRHENLRLSSTRYLDRVTLHREPPVYDAYITGSDQVWNPKIQRNDSSYFLTFAPPGKKRISYAASFGISSLPDRFVSEYRDWLGQLHCVSTREFEGKRIIEQISGRDAQVTLDPTLLLDGEQWSQIAAPYVHKRPYILYYCIWGDRLMTSSSIRIARQVSTLTGWDIISVGGRPEMKLVLWRNCVPNAGPSEFVGLFQNASFVVTDSFHGTAFAINYERPFAVIANLSLPPEQARSSRITTLLKMLGIENRLVPAGVQSVGRELIELDYRKGQSLLQGERQRSIRFLRDALEGA